MKIKIEKKEIKDLLEKEDDLKTANPLASHLM